MYKVFRSVTDWLIVCVNVRGPLKESSCGAPWTTAVFWLRTKTYYINMLTANLSTVGRQQNHPPKRSLSGLCPTTMSLTIEGFTSEKEKIISHRVKGNNIDVLCLQETHRNKFDHNPFITNTKIIGRRPYNK